MRFALLEAKVAILDFYFLCFIFIFKVAILATWRRFSFTPGTKTMEPMEMEPNSALGYTKGGVWAKVVERE